MLTSLGITDAERATIATIYSPGMSFWRMQLVHLSTYDPNMGKGYASDATSPNVAANVGRTSCPSDGDGSIIEYENQYLGERVPVAGTPYSLSHWSNRTTGDVADRTSNIVIPAIPTIDIKRIDVEWNIAGRTQHGSFLYTPDIAEQIAYRWDGLDWTGRRVQGQQNVQIRVGFVYQAVYVDPTSFGSQEHVLLNNVTTVRDGSVSGIGGGSGGAGTPEDGPVLAYGSEITFWTDFTDTVGTMTDDGLGLGGWELSAHNVYDNGAHKVYRGDGTRFTGDAVAPTSVTTWIGDLDGDCDALPGRALAQCLYTGIFTGGLAVGRDGSVYYDDNGGSISDGARRRDPNGTVYAIGPVGVVEAIAVSPQGQLYIAMQTQGGSQILKVAPDGSWTVIAGNGSYGAAGDGGLAVNASLFYVTSMAAAADGSLYVAQFYNIRRIDPSGVISTYVAPSDFPIGYSAFGQSSGFAPVAIALDSYGNLWGVSNSRYTIAGFLFEVTASGVKRVVSNPYATSCPPGDISNCLVNSQWLAIGPDDVIYLSVGNFLNDGHGSQIVTLTPDGVVNNFVGFGGQVGGENVSAYTQAIWPTYVAVLPDNSLLYFDGRLGAVRRVGSQLPGWTGDATLISDAERSLIYSFDGTGRHVQTFDAKTSMPLLTFAYDANSFLSTVTDIDGNVTTVQRDGTGAPTAIVAPYGQMTEVGLDGSGRLIQLTNPNYESTLFGYGSDNLLASMTDARGGVHAFSYGSDGRLLFDGDPAGGSTTLFRSPYDSPSSFGVLATDALGSSADYVDQISSTSELKTTYGYDGLTTKTSRDPSGAVTSTSPDGTVVTSSPINDPRFGGDTAFGSTAAVLPSGLTMTVASSESVSLSNGGDPLSVTGLVDTTTINGGSGSVNGSTLTSVYDASSRTWTSYSSTTPARIATSTLDANGHVVAAQVGGLTPVAFAYDAGGRLTTLSQGTRTSSIAYGADGLPASFTDALSRTTTVSRDPVGRPLTLGLPDGRLVQMTYDANGNVATVTPPGRPTYDMGYTPVDLLATDLPPDAPGVTDGVTQYAYDTSKKLTSASLPDGDTVQYTYDGAERLSDITYPGENVFLGYNPTTGRLAVLASSVETTTFANDGPLVTNMTSGGVVASSLNYTYDSQLRLSSESLDGEVPIGRTYDADGLLTQVGALAVGRDPASGLVTGTGLGFAEDSVQYNGYGEPTAYTATLDGTTLYTVAYVRDALGRITAKTETNGGSSYAWGYAYDATGRLTDVTLGGATYAHYDFDPNGNRLDRVSSLGTETGTYDAQDRVETYDGKTYTWTANGALATVTNETGTTTFTYDAVGNLRHVVTYDGTTIDYAIDGANRRIGKKVNGTLVQAFVYGGGLGPLAELDGAGNLVSRFVYAGGGNVPEYMVKGGETYRFVKDQLGSPRMIVDVTTGHVAQQMDFDEYGRVLNDSAPGFQPFGFAGGLRDATTGLVRFGARDYDAGLGRWTAKDPLRFDGGQANLYEYVYSDPVNKFDPTGLVTTEQVLDQFGNFFAGAASAVTFGLSDKLIAATGLAPSGFQCSTAHTIGALAGALLTSGAGEAGVVAKVGRSSKEAIELGLVRSGGKLAGILQSIEKKFIESATRSWGLQARAAWAVQEGAAAVGLGGGQVIAGGVGESIVASNVGNVLTTITVEGEILITREGDVLLHLIP